MNLINFKKNLSVVILCGGRGLRLKPITNKLPKPLIRINKKSILENIILHFIKYDISNFIVVTVYKNILIDKFIKKKFKNLDINTIYTGVNTDIIKRLKKISNISKNFLLVCYGDTLIDINLNTYINFYLKDSSKISLASFQLKSNFGIIEITGNNTITKFREKPILDIWFNVGYLFFKKKNFSLFNKISTFKNLLTFLAKNKLLRAFKHKGNHITINTIEELEQAKIKIKEFDLNEKK